MTNEKLLERNARKLMECNPWLHGKVVAILKDLRGHGYRPRIQEAWRSPADQILACLEGRSKVRWGFHNATGKANLPDALAADIVLDDCPYKEPREFLLKLYSSAKAHGLETGILFGLSAAQRVRFNKAVDAKDWTYSGPIGWDPWHVQPAMETLAIAEAKRGERP